MGQTREKAPVATPDLVVRASGAPQPQEEARRISIRINKKLTKLYLAVVKNIGKK
jgi:hypothetical protein